jgi:membrane protein DedA with SNARE-associated domain
MGDTIFFGHSIIDLVATYGYFVLIPIMLLEGPIIGILAGFLASLGVFNPYVVWLVLVISEITSDAFLFHAPRHTAALRRFGWINKLLKKLEGTEISKRGEEYGKFLRDRFVAITIILKSMPIPHLYPATLVASSMAGLPPRVFYTTIVPIHLVRSALFVSFGYFFGASVQDISTLFNGVGIFLLALIIVLFVYYRFAHRYVAEYVFGQTFAGQWLASKEAEEREVDGDKPQR